MKPYKASVMGEDFLLFSQENFRGPSCALSGVEKTVGLFPSIEADFSLIGYTECGNPLSDYRAAAICAAAFLILKRGLPLTEFVFETPCGNVEIFYTDSGMFETKAPKCKQVITNIANIMGCEAEYTDFFADATHRVIKTKCMENFDISVLRHLAGIGPQTPSCVTVYSERDGEIDMRTYTEHICSPPSVISAFAVASYSAFLKNRLSQYTCGGAYYRLSFCGAVVGLCPEIKEEAIT